MCRAIVFFVFFFKSIGLATFSVIIVERKKKQQKKAVYFIWSRFGMYYNILISCLVITSNYITIPIIYYQEYEYKTIITTVIEVFQGILGSTIMPMTLLYYCVNQSMIVRFGNSLIDVLDELHRLREPVNRKRIVSILLSIYLLELGLFVAVLITDYVAFQTNPLAWIASIMPMGFINWLFIQYYTTLLVIHAIFVKLNKIIRNICTNRTTDISLCLNRSRRIFINTTGIQSLLQLRSMHSYVCDISIQVLEFYSVPILLGTVLLFLTLLYCVYYFLEPLVINQIVDSMAVLNGLFYIIFILYPLGLLTTRVTKIGAEIDQTGCIVHTLLNCTIDREVKTELKLFSLQLLHQKPKFTAVGYFVLDNTFFQSVLSTVTTYLVILIQFQMVTPDPTDRDHNYTRNCSDGKC